MTSTQFTPKTILDIKTKFTDANPLKADIQKTRKNKNFAKFPTYYIPVVYRANQNEHQPLFLKFKKIVLLYSPKVKEENDKKTASITLKRITVVDLADSEYEESKRADLVREHNEFLDALDCVKENYVKVVQDQILTYSGDKFFMSKNQNKTINQFCQEERKGRGNEPQMVAFEKHEYIYRFNLNIDANTGRIGREFEYEDKSNLGQKKKVFKYQVFDVKKAYQAKQKGENKEFHAQVQVGDELQDLTVDTCRSFITPQSIANGTIQFESICISKSGISLIANLRDLHVWRHAPKARKMTIDDDDLNEFASFGGATDNTLVVQEPEQAKNQTDSFAEELDAKLNITEPVIDEPAKFEEPDDIDPDVEEPVKKPTKKSSKKKPVE